MTSSLTLIAGFVPKYWDKKIGENLRPRLFLYEFAEKRPIPMGTGKTIIIPRVLKKNSPATVVRAASEGFAPTLCSLSSQLLSGTLSQFVGGYRHSDIIAMIGLTDIVPLAVKEIGYTMANQMDYFTWSQISGTGLTLYGNGATVSSSAVGTSILKIKDIMKATVTLDRVDNPRFPGANAYAGLLHPVTKYDIWTQTSSGAINWIDVVKYVDAGVERIFNGEVGKIAGVKFVESSRQRTGFNVTDAGKRISGGVSSAHTWIFAPEAYYATALEGLGAPQTFVKPLGSAGAADPANQFGTVAAKVLFTIIPVNYTATEYRMVRIIHARTIA